MDVTQIQIVPVENGFFIQVVNADGSGNFHPRRIANSRDQLVEEVKKLAEGLYTKEPIRPQVPPQPQPTAENPTSDGTR